MTYNWLVKKSDWIQNGNMKKIKYEWYRLYEVNMIFQIQNSQYMYLYNAYEFWQNSLLFVSIQSVLKQFLNIYFASVSNKTE